MKKIICTQGLQASGKSTWAKDFVAKNPWWMRVNKDEIRKQLGITYEVYDKKVEQRVIDAERAMVDSMTNAGFNIIVDNTHLLLKRSKVNKHLDFYRKLAESKWYEFEVKTFFITPEEAIKRDANREDKDAIVGEDVIKRTLSYSVLPPEFPANPKFVEPISWLIPCIICDIDGTLAFMNGKRSPYDYSKVEWDDVNIYLKELLYLLTLETNVKLIFMSGREEDCKYETVTWLTENGFVWNEIHMRKSWDVRCDTIVKEEMYNNHIKNKYNVLAVFDDRNRVVDTWRRLGLPTYQVWYWDF